MDLNANSKNKTMSKSNRKVSVIQGNGFPLRHTRVLPNDPCPCGSGKKAKRCCGTDTSFFYSKLTKAQEAEKTAREKEKINQQKDETAEV